MPRSSGAELAAPTGEPTESVAARVAEAQKALNQRHSEASPDARSLLDQAVDRLPLSARGRARSLRVATTVAALAGSTVVESEHIAEALSYRAPSDFNTD